jgi:hypothetical protein
MNGLTIELQGERVAASLIRANSIVSDDDQDAVLLRQMKQDAERYISSFSWCKEVLDSYFGGGVGGIFAVFLFHIRSSRPDVEPWIWVVVGDIPPAYLPLTDCKSAAEVFRTYIRGMSNWVELARKGQKGTPEQGVPPVDVPATPEWAERLSQRLYGLTLAVKALFEDDSPGGWPNLSDISPFMG